MKGVDRIGNAITSFKERLNCTLIRQVGLQAYRASAIWSLRLDNIGQYKMQVWCLWVVNERFGEKATDPTASAGYQNDGRFRGYWRHSKFTGRRGIERQGLITCGCAVTNLWVDVDHYGQREYTLSGYVVALEANLMGVLQCSEYGPGCRYGV